MHLDSKTAQPSSERLYVDPHSLLGLHETARGQKVIRLLRPGAPYAYIELFGTIVPALKVAEEGLFEVEVPSHTTLRDYRIYLQGGTLAHDPYAFWPTFSPFDAYLFGKGVHYRLYESMGGRLCVHQEVTGVKFAVWAPHAQRVALVGDFNLWDGRSHPMRSLGASGVWELFIPGLDSGQKYKFEILSQQGQLQLKADPYALYSERRPQTASIVASVDAHVWCDAPWIERRERTQLSTSAMLIYEVHLPSWKKKEGHLLNYRDSASLLATYCKQMGFTHVELLPLCEHPLDESWGYQVTGFFSVTSRMGSVEDFQYFVDHLHQEGIGVILDWVPAHFPRDGHGLARFDGSYLYEHEDPQKGLHPDWNTSIFNYGRHEVSNFLIASALFWLDKMHIDGLRVDAVASMLYLDYGRKQGDWTPNCFGGHYNLEAIEWMKHLNAVIQERFPSVERIAEESTAFPGVTCSVERGGLGFTMKWNMGWMNDTLRYFSKDPLFRSYHQREITFPLVYAFSERFVLPLSHDEVVHSKASLLSKMPGDDWQKFANLRLLYSYELCQVGKKLLFMGAEIGQWEEWNALGQLPWDLLQFDRHAALHLFFKEMNFFYRDHPALWERDFDPEGFSWVDCSDQTNSVVSYLRKGRRQVLLVVHNFTPAYFESYDIPLRRVHTLKELFNTDRIEYFGSGKVALSVQIDAAKVSVCLPPLATLIFEVEFEL
jgi:1,4-alpha-glucan branching enzyme